MRVIEMANLWLTTLLLSSIVISMPQANGIPQSPGDVEKWFQNLPNMKEKTSKLHFYFHDTVSGPIPSAAQIAKSTIQSTTAFGLTFMADDPLTMGPDPNSKIIGRAQGIYSSASQEELGLLMNFNLVITDGEFNGSTLSMVGRNPVFHEYREMAIVGGSGDFRLARGIATAKTYFLNSTTGDAIVEYHVIVIHY